MVFNRCQTCYFFCGTPSPSFQPLLAVQHMTCSLRVTGFAFSDITWPTPTIYWIYWSKNCYNYNCHHICRIASYGYLWYTYGISPNIPMGRPQPSAPQRANPLGRLLASTQHSTSGSHLPSSGWTYHWTADPLTCFGSCKWMKIIESRKNPWRVKGLRKTPSESSNSQKGSAEMITGISIWQSKQLREIKHLSAVGHKLFATVLKQFWVCPRRYGQCQRGENWIHIFVYAYI